MHDVIVVGGSYAGLSASLQLARARKRVLVIDAGLRRNRFAAESHGFLAQDGRPPAAIAEAARAQLLAYPTVTWVEGRAVEATGAIDAFAVSTADGARHAGRRIVLSGGVRDELPGIPGLEGQWGAGAMTCPYCHGYELDRGDLAVIATGPMALHHAVMVSEWGPVTFHPNGAFPIDEAARRDLEHRGIAVEPAPIAAVEGPRGRPELVLADGRRRAYAGVFVATRAVLSSDLPAQLGCALADTPVGALIAVDAQQATSVPGVFACGDAASPMASIALAVGSGAMAGSAAHRSLIFAEPARAAA
jgi:thioredoxin reductase